MSVDISKVHFDEKGLVPAIVQEESGQVLMLAYMNKESLEKTIETGLTLVLQPQPPASLAERGGVRQYPAGQGDLL